MRSVLAVLVVALLATGCGSVDRDPDLAEAVEKTESTGSSSFALGVVEDDPVGSGESFECEGAADFSARRMRLECGEYGEFIAVEDVFYARGWGVGFGIPRDEPWVRIPIEEGDSPHDFAPATLLAKLRAASVETERLGEEEVRGEATEHYRMTVDCTEADIECPGDTTDVDVWIDGEGLVRRVTMRDGRADVKAEFFEFGRDVDVESPPESQVSDIDDPQLEPCPGGGSPISDDELRGALEAQGFQVPDGGGECLRGVAAAVAAVIDEGNPGAVVCYVYMADSGGPAAVEEASRGRLVGYRLQNVACSSYDESTEDPAVVRLRAALADLE